MKPRKPLFLIIAFVVLFTLVTPGEVSAVGAGKIFPDGEIIFGGNYRLESGETLDGDLVMLGGSADIREGAVVEGGIFLMGGSLNVDGTVNGDIVMAGGVTTLQPHAFIRGDVTTFGGPVYQAEGSRLQGEIISGANNPFRFQFPNRVFTPGTDFNPFYPIWAFWGFVARALLLAALAMLVVLLAPQTTSRVAASAVAKPVETGAVGLLTVIVVPFVLVLMVITIIGIPVAVLAVILLGLAVLFGWVALGTEIGRRVANLFRARWSQPVLAGVGMILLQVLAQLADLIACVGWILPFLVTVLGLGAIILTRFGSRYYPPGAAVFPAGVQPGPISPATTYSTGSTPSRRDAIEPLPRPAPPENFDQD